MRTWAALWLPGTELHRAGQVLGPVSRRMYIQACVAQQQGQGRPSVVGSVHTSYGWACWVEGLTLEPSHWLWDLPVCVDCVLVPALHRCCRVAAPLARGLPYTVLLQVQVLAVYIATQTFKRNLALAFDAFRNGPCVAAERMCPAAAGALCGHMIRCAPHRGW